ncbi:MAG: ComEC/Rec2 family competence protein, partial [Bacilli bacterium]|nr:ComEC/Rec2 family competence protein [Bacilli bacterium]
MLRLRKILLCNYLYIVIIFIVGIITLIRLNTTITYNSPYAGTITKIVKIDNKTSITIDNKVIGTTYKNININLGDKIKVYGEFNNNYISISKYKIISKNKNIYYFIKSKLISTFNNRYLYTFILGDKSYLDKDVVRSYQENGISHLFAISGMHISLLVLMITKILKLFKFNEYDRFKITSIILFLYLLLVGFSPSILRGVLFYFLFTINNIYYFYIKKINLFILVIS